MMRMERLSRRGEERGEEGRRGGMVKERGGVEQKWIKERERASIGGSGGDDRK